MPEILVWHERPSLDRIIFICGLPGVGNVGKIAADFMSSALETKPLATIFSDELPPQVMVDSECVGRMMKQELRYCRTGDHDVVFLLGDSQATTTQGMFNLSKSVFDIIVAYDPELIVTLGGYGIGTIVTDPRVLGVVTDPSMKERMSAHGIGFFEEEPAGGIIGAAAVMLGLAKIYGIEAISVIGETSGSILDYKSARSVVEAVSGIIGKEFDLSEFKAQVEMIDQFNSQVADAPAEDLSYIGRFFK